MWVAHERRISLSWRKIQLNWTWKIHFEDIEHANETGGSFQCTKRNFVKNGLHKALQSIQAFQASKKLKGLGEFSCVSFVEFSIDFEDDIVVGLLPLGRQAQLCRANNYRAMSSDYYMDNTLQKYRVPVFVMLPLDLIVFGECKQMKLRRYIKLALLFSLFVVNFFFFLLSSPTLSNWKLLYPYQGSKSKASVHCTCFQALNSQYL